MPKRQPIAGTAWTLTPAEPRAGRRANSPLQLAAIAAAACLITILLRVFVVQLATIPSGSMESGIRIGDRVIVTTLFTGHPRPGAIVVFPKPAGVYEPGVQRLIKRVIGTPGQYVRTGAGGAIYIDGKMLAQPWLSAAARAHPGAAICSQNRTDCNGTTLHLPPGQYLVMGDNRANSYDGRYFGPIAGPAIIGQAQGRLLPLSRLDWF